MDAVLCCSVQSLLHPLVQFFLTFLGVVRKSENSLVALLLTNLKTVATSRWSTNELYFREWTVVSHSIFSYIPKATGENKNYKSQVGANYPFCIRVSVCKTCITFAGSSLQHERLPISPRPAPSKASVFFELPNVPMSLAVTNGFFFCLILLRLLFPFQPSL